MREGDSALQQMLRAVFHGLQRVSYQPFCKLLWNDLLRISTDYTLCC